MSYKKIDINPDLFSIGGKPKKKREKTQKKAPLISPNVLKNKLLKRIKEHKNKETENLVNNKTKLPDPQENKSNKNTNPNLVDLGSYTDEFTDSLNYLQTLATQKKDNENKNKLEKKTLKNHQSILSNTNLSIPIVNIDLPDELKEPLISVNTSNLNFNNQSPISLKTVNDSVPYGCLKNGSKPTYRTWNKTQKYIVEPNPKLTIVDTSLNKNNIERENRLNILKNKIKEKELLQQTLHNNNNNIVITTDVPNVIPNVIPNVVPIINELPTVNTIANDNIVFENIIMPNAEENIMISTETNSEIIPTKKFIKKTIRKKYTLGKSKIKKSIGVLIKDRGTRKKVLTAQRELKKKSINDIKSYLRDHNLIKIGTNAPNDVIRKLYESSMLAGEITNSNTEILLHNLMKDDKEL